MTRCSNSQCFKLVPDNSKFCSYCGEKVISSSTSPIPPDSSFDEISIENFEPPTALITKKTIKVGMNLKIAMTTAEIGNITLGKAVFRIKR